MSIFEVSTRLPNTYQFNNNNSSQSTSATAAAAHHHHHHQRHSHYSNQSSSAMANLSAYSSSSPNRHTRFLQPTISSANHHNHYSSVLNNRATAPPRSSSVTSPSPSRFYSDSGHFSNTDNPASTDIPFTYTRTGSGLNNNNNNNTNSKYLTRVLTSNPSSSSRPKPQSAYFSTNPSRPSSEHHHPSVEYIQLNPGSATASATVLPVFYQRSEPNKSSFPVINNNRASMLEIGPLTYRSNSALAQSYDPVSAKPNNNNNNNMSTSDRLMKMYHRNMHNTSNSNFLFNNNTQTNSLDRQNSEPGASNQYQIKLTPKDFSVIKSVKVRNDMLKSNENDVMNSKPHGNLVMLQNKLDEMTTSDRPYSSASQQDRHSAIGIDVMVEPAPPPPANNRQKSILVSKKRMGPSYGPSITNPGSASSTPKKTVTFAD